MSKATRGLQAATQPWEKHLKLSPSHLFTPHHPAGLQNSAMSLRWHFSDPRGLPKPKTQTQAAAPGRPPGRGEDSGSAVLPCGAAPS